MNKRKILKERERNKEERVMKFKECSGVYFLKEMSFYLNSSLVVFIFFEKLFKFSGNYFYIVLYEWGD